MKKYKHLSYEERFAIEKLVAAQCAVREIADFLGRSPNTISREINKNRVHSIYTAERADAKVSARRWRAKRQCLKVALDSFLTIFVEERLEKKWSPKQISGHLRRIYGITCSDKAIYKFIESRGLEHHLFWRWNRRRGGPKRRTHAPSYDGRKYLDTRPPLENEAGHLEVDFMVSKMSAWVFMVTVDRHTRRTWVRKLRNRKRHTIRAAFSVLSREVSIKSITTDNDIAFQHWPELEAMVHAPIYFCHPYHSWEKGLVENTNRWMRCFVPKRRDIGTVSEEEMAEIHAFLNDRPREVIGFRSPREYYEEITSVLLEG
jgi:IS30 family transposase